jgi:hypothetical protein
MKRGGVHTRDVAFGFGYAVFRSEEEQSYTKQNDNDNRFHPSIRHGRRTVTRSWVTEALWFLVRIVRTTLRGYARRPVVAGGLLKGEVAPERWPLPDTSHGGNEKLDEPTANWSVVEPFVRETEATKNDSDGENGEIYTII